MTQLEYYKDRVVYIIQNELFLVYCLTDCLSYQRVVYLNFILPTSSERLGLVVVLYVRAHCSVTNMRQGYEDANPSSDQPSCA